MKVANAFLAERLLKLADRPGRGERVVTAPTRASLPRAVGEAEWQPTSAAMRPAALRPQEEVAEQ